MEKIPEDKTPKNADKYIDFVTDLKTRCRNDNVCKTLLENILKGRQTNETDLKELQMHEPIEKLYVSILSDPDLYLMFNQSSL